MHGLGLDSPLLRYANGQTLAFHQDAFGSVMATTDAANGTVLATQGFDAFGNVEAALTTATPTPTYGYTGREPDATGLTYFRARYYQPKLGRFTQADPAGFIDGVNRYTYAMNAPVNYTDPLGLAAVGSLGAGSAYAGNQNSGGWLGWAQVGLDVVGATAEYAPPGIGTAISMGADLLSGGISYLRGDNVAAAASLAAMLPYAGSLGSIFKASHNAGNVAGLGGDIARVVDDAAGASASYSDLVKAAQAKYPGKAGKVEDHHITPKYLGGDPKGPTAPIDAAYHQEVTNAFRAEWGYGKGKPSQDQLRDIMQSVYERFPLPGQ